MTQGSIKIEAYNNG